MFRTSSLRTALCFALLSLALPSARAGGGCDGDIYAGNAINSVNPGAVCILDPSTFAGVVLGNPVGPSGLSGLTFTPDGRLWGSVRSGGSSTQLAEIDPATGALVSSTAITDGVGFDVRIADLATQPGSGTVFGVGSGTGAAFGSLYTIDTVTAVATYIGNAGQGNDGGLAFAPNGTLYMISAGVANPFLATIDPSNGSPITLINYGPHTGCDGLVVRPSDGALLATRGAFAGGDLVVRVDATTGTTTALGSTSTGTPSDLAFQPCETGTVLCFGDGSGTACPCGNGSSIGSGGCRNSVSGAQGALYTASGTASVSAPNLSLECQRVRTQPGLHFQGNNVINGGAGVVFGDGLRCCGGNVIRLFLEDPPPSAEPVTVTTTISVTPPGVLAGDSRCHQYWYRDPGGPCGSNFNLSNAVRVTWIP